MDAQVKHLQGGLGVTENAIKSDCSDLYGAVNIDVSMGDSRTVIYPVSNWQPGSDGPYEFTIDKRSSRYIIGPLCKMFVQLKVTRKDGSDLQLTDKVSCVNLMATSLFKTVEMSTNANEITDLQASHYNYKCYYENTVGFGVDARNSVLDRIGMCMDDAGEFDDVGADAIVGVAGVAATNTAPEVKEVKAVARLDSENTGFNTRMIWIGLTQVKQFMTPLHQDLFQQTRAIGPDFPFTLRFTRECDAFLLLSPHPNADYKVVIEKLELHMHQVDFCDPIIKQHDAALLRGLNMNYPFNRTIVKAFPINPNTKAIDIENMFDGILPKTLVIGMLETSAFQGHYKKNPYRFQHFGLVQAYITYDEIMIPAIPYKPNFPENMYMHMFSDFFDNTGSSGDVGNVISYKMYKDGCCLSAYDRNPEKCNNYHHHPNRVGRVSMHYMLKDGFKEPITVMAFATFPSVTTIDVKQQVRVIMK